MCGGSYSSDVSDEQWEILRRLLPPRSCCGRKPLDRRAVLDAILYVLLTGCQWRALPQRFSEMVERVHDLPPLEIEWNLGSPARHLARMLSPTSRQEADADRRDHRQSNHPNLGHGQRSTGLRRREKTARPQATFGSRYVGIGVGHAWCMRPRFRIKTELSGCWRNFTTSSDA